ncbi:MAG: DUF4258 domain-containing protein [Euryarchaeota archaeon]|nr:DUF4258 domain-containing protein [Euryarchaeota archaeon]
MSNIRYSRHARLRMVERGISHQEVKNAINKGAKRLQGSKIVSTYAYFEVVYKCTRKPETRYT